MPQFDVLVVGGGPAGLSAAIYASRAHRSVLVIDKKAGRWNHAQRNENYLGFPRGVSARALRLAGKMQAEKFGATCVEDEAISVKKTNTGFLVKGHKKSYRGRALILSTGVTDHFPSFIGAERYIGRSLFWCLLCDGPKLEGNKITVMDNGAKEQTVLSQASTRISSAMGFMNLSMLKVGQMIAIVASTGADGALMASTIRLY